MDISLSNAIIAETAQQRGLSAENLSAAAARVVRPLLGGENVRVSAALTGDLQKLLAQLRSDQEEKKVQLARLQLSAVLTQLCAMESLTLEQQTQVSAIQVQIEALEAAIERETTTAAARKKALETKRQLESDAQDELRAAEAKGDKAAIAAAQKKLESAQTQAAALEKEIATLDAEISARKREITGYSAELTDLLAKLDYPALVMVLAAITISAADAEADGEVKKEDDADGKGIPTPLEVVRESLEKAVEDIREEIVEKRVETV